MELDSIIPHLDNDFLKKHPKYQFLETKNYEDYENQEIVLL
jgi:hypothetical protein